MFDKSNGNLSKLNIQKMKKSTLLFMYMIAICMMCTMNIFATPDPSAISGSAYVCYNQTGVTYSVVDVPGTTYTWTSPSGSTIASGQGTSSITVDFGATFGDVCVTADDGSGASNPVCLTTQYATARPNNPTPISGQLNTVCPGQILTYSVPADPTADYFTWIAPANSTIIAGQGTNSIQLSLGATFTWGYLRVSATNCRGTQGQVVVGVYSEPVTPGPVTGPTVGACAGSTQTYSITPVNGATSYTWTAPLGSIISSAAASGNPLTTSATTVDVTFPAGFTVGTLSVVASSGCGSSNPRVVQLRSIPMKPGRIFGLLYGLCDLANVAYNVDPVPGALSYNWTLSPASAGTINGNGNNAITIDFTGSFTVATLCVTAINDCGSSITRCQRLYAPPQTPGPIAGPIGACNTNPLTSIAFYSISPVFGAADYTWTVPTGATITAGQGTTNVTVDFLGSSSGDVAVMANNVCGSSPNRVLGVIVNACRMSAQPSSENSFAVVSAYPNPTKDKITVDFTSATDEKIIFSIADAQGRIVSEKNVDAVAGINNTDFDLSSLSKGIYVLNVSSKGEHHFVRIIKD